MVPSYYQIILMFTIQTTQISTYWVSYRGLWYYISENGDTRNYTDAVNYCRNLSGHLATIVNNHQRNFLIDHTGYTKHWVGLSTIHMNHNDNCSNINMVWAGDYTCAVDYFKYRTQMIGVSCFAYTLIYSSSTVGFLTVSDCKMKFGFICQWQCHTLDVVANDVSDVTGVYEQQHYQSNCKYYANSNLYTDQVKSLYAEIVTDTSIFCSNFSSYDCPYKWSFSYGDMNKLYTISQHFTPYNSNQWQSHDSNENPKVFFTCRDCIEYEVTFTNDSMESIVTVNKHTAYEYKNESDQRNPILSFDRDSPHWCYTENGQQLFCLEYHIVPIRYISSYTTENYSSISLSCITMDHSDIEEFTTASTTMQSVTTGQLQHREPESTEKVSTLTTHTHKIESSPDVSTSLFVNTHDYHSNTEPTTILDLYATDPQNKKDNLNTSNGKMYAYIGLAVGVVLPIVIAVVIGVVLYRKRNASKDNTEKVIQNLDDVHVITDTNIYSEHPSIRDPPTNRATHISVQNGLSDQSNRTGAAPNIPPRSHAQGTRRAAPVPDTSTDPIFQSHNLVDVQGDKAGDHGSNTDAHGSSNRPMPIYSEVNKLKKLVPPVPTEPVYSQVSQKTKTVNGERKHETVQHRGVNCADNNDVYESEKMLPGETQSHTGENSDEEFSDNELYERDTPTPTHHQPHIRTNVFDNITFNVDPEGEDIEMIDNDVYAKT